MLNSLDLCNKIKNLKKWVKRFWLDSDDRYYIEGNVISHSHSHRVSQNPLIYEQCKPKNKPKDLAFFSVFEDKALDSKTLIWQPNKISILIKRKLELSLWSVAEIKKKEIWAGVMRVGTLSTLIATVNASQKLIINYRTL